MCGRPSTGKTVRATELLHYLESQGYSCILINEEFLGINKAEGYSSTFNEKNTRSLLKSVVERELDSAKYVIFDSMNYIKGYRYELYCLVRNVRTTHCIILCDTSLDVARSWNTAYPPELFEDLWNRLEIPNPKNRWDRPLFTLHHTSPLPLEEITSALSTANLPREPVSTKKDPILASNYLYESDQITQQVIELILRSQEQYSEGTEISLPNITVPISDYFSILTSLTPSISLQL